MNSSPKPLHRRSAAPAGRQRGFSLVEMIAAFLVFAIAIGVLMQVLSGSLRNARVSTTYTYAALWAQSKLDVLGVGEPIEPGHSSGSFDDDYRWELTIDEVDASEIEPPAQMTVADALDDATELDGAQAMADPNAGMSPVQLYEARLVVSWGGSGAGNERSAEFITLRAANPDLNAMTGTRLGTPRAGQSQRTPRGGVQPAAQQDRRQGRGR